MMCLSMFQRPNCARAAPGPHFRSSSPGSAIFQKLPGAWAGRHFARTSVGGLQEGEMELGGVEENLGVPRIPMLFYGRRSFLV